MRGGGADPRFGRSDAADRARLIVATHGGGTKLPTQRECLEVLGCTGEGSVFKLAEIVGGVALAGELSLGAAISSLDWVSSHERLGRNR